MQSRRIIWNVSAVCWRGKWCGWWCVWIVQENAVLLTGQCEYCFHSSRWSWEYKEKALRFDCKPEYCSPPRVDLRVWKTLFFWLTASVSTALLLIRLGFGMCLGLDGRSLPRIILLQYEQQSYFVNKTYFQQKNFCSGLSFFLSFFPWQNSTSRLLLPPTTYCNTNLDSFLFIRVE